MVQYTTFRLAGGGTIQLESTRQPPPVAGTGPQEASAESDRAWKEGAALVAEVGGEVVRAMRGVFTDVDEVVVEFGANITGKAGVILVEGTAAANLKVVIKWKKIE